MFEQLDEKKSYGGDGGGNGASGVTSGTAPSASAHRIKLGTTNNSNQQQQLMQHRHPYNVSRSFATPPGYKASNAAKNRLSLRDLRQIDPTFSSAASILVREEAVLVTLEGVKAIILSDRLLIFNADDAGVKQATWQIEKALTQNVESSFIPFEFRALDGIFIHICLSLESDFSLLERELMASFNTLPKNISNDSLEKLRRLEQRLTYYGGLAKKVQQSIQAILDDDEDMSNMYLT